ncbi:glycosyltransferase family A protein [uncultured Helicobacter sp.]|uniref:glycosyltransferase family A protein n=1 Tax=uncultured Helicobacter sp. TaxID=175537 RepID=UPI00260F9A5E|nr:glycosyltransferase family A protein [uncultured Helicobacter sp.]
MQALRDEEIVFFMDADDIMNPDYTLQCIRTYTSNPSVEMIFCDIKTLCNSTDPIKRESPHPYGNLGFGIFRTFYLKEYLGHSPSCISIRQDTLAKILPLNLENIMEN